MVRTSPAQAKSYIGEDIGPIGFDETPPWEEDSSTKNGEQSSEPEKTVWNAYRGIFTKATPKKKINWPIVRVPTTKALPPHQSAG